MPFSLFIDVSNYHFSFKHFITREESLQPFIHPALILTFPPALSRQNLFFWPYRPACSGHFIKCNMSSLVPGFLHWHSVFKVHLCVAGVNALLLFMANVPPAGCASLCLSIHQLMDITVASTCRANSWQRRTSNSRKERYFFQQMGIGAIGII